MAKTDKDGKFKIEKIPAGKWKFQFVHEAGYIGRRDGHIKVDDKPAKWSKGRTLLVIADGKETKVGTVAVDAGVFK